MATEREGDDAPRTLLLPLVEIVTVGAPFCAFKLLTGWLLLRSERYWIVGAALATLGAIDALFNTANFLSLALGRRERPLPLCTLTGVFRSIGRRDTAFAELGTSLDVLLSFTLVATMIWSGSIPRLGEGLARVWSACTVLNVIGAGAGRVASALSALRERR